MEDLERDVRLISRELAKGFLSRDKLNEQLAQLPDVADLGEWIDVEADDAEGADQAGEGAGDE